jgi:hypothetical protein
VVIVHDKITAKSFAQDDIEDPHGFYYLTTLPGVIDHEVVVLDSPSRSG